MSILLIPKIVHRIALGGRAVPEHLERNWQTLRGLLPAWEFRTWTEANLPRLRNQSEFDDCVRFPMCRYGLQSDILRYELLLDHGGLYVDTDVEFFKDPAPYLTDAALLTTSRYSDEAPDGLGAIENAMLGATPQHPLYRTLVDELPRNFREHRMEAGWESVDGSVAMTGPSFLARVLRRVYEKELPSARRDRDGAWTFGDAKIFADELFKHRWSADEDWAGRVFARHHSFLNWGGW